MKNLFYLIIGVSILSASCEGNKSFTTQSGNEVTYLRKGEGGIPADTSITYFTLKYTTEKGGVLFETTPESPSPIRIDSNFRKRTGDFFEVITSLEVGDSVEYYLSASDLFVVGFNRPVPDTIDAQSKMKIEISCIKEVGQAEYNLELAERRKEFMESQIDTAQVAKELVIMKEYFERNNLNPKSTRTGLHYIIKEEGSGPKPRFGQLVKVNYAGWVLDGEYFDSNIKEIAMEKGLYDERREPYGPYPFEIYTGPVILGWHEGISLLNEGSKATLYIPSPLGYGPRARSEVIVPNSILVFDVELVEVVQ